MMKSSKMFESMVADCALKITKRNTNSCCFFSMYQPKIPAKAMECKK